MAQDSHPLMQRISTLEVGSKRTEPTNKEYTDSSQLKVRQVGDYLFQGKIGEGAFGVIHRCRSLIDNATYVIKEIKIGLDGSGKNESLLEAQLLQKIRHKNIVRYHDSFMKGDMLFLVMEYCDRGDMSGYIKRMSSSMDIPEFRLWKFFI
jgi:serine/threonine protein kinase